MNAYDYSRAVESTKKYAYLPIMTSSRRIVWLDHYWRVRYVHFTHSPISKMFYHEVDSKYVNLTVDEYIIKKLTGSFDTSKPDAIVITTKPIRK